VEVFEATDVPPREADPIRRETEETMSREEDMKRTKAQLCDLLDEYRRDRDETVQVWAEAELQCVRGAERIEELEAKVKRLTKLVRKVYNTTTDAALVRSLGQSLKSQPL
jgi:hypothetical protein